VEPDVSESVWLDLVMGHNTERSLYCQREKYIVFREGNIVPCNGPYTTYPNKLFLVRSWCMMSLKFTK
jgi:hypothetical protein